MAVAATAGTDYLAPGALPNGTTATTQSVADNTTKLATDAFVLANTSGGVTSSIFYIASNCGGLSNCLTWVDDDGVVQTELAAITVT